MAFKNVRTAAMLSARRMTPPITTHVNVPHSGRPSRDLYAEPDGLERQQRAEVNGPREHGQAGAVPDTHQAEAGDEIDVQANRRAVLADNRQRQVIAQPGNQRDVPAPPEL